MSFKNDKSPKSCDKSGAGTVKNEYFDIYSVSFSSDSSLNMEDITSIETKQNKNDEKTLSIFQSSNGKSGSPSLLQNSINLIELLPPRPDSDEESAHKNGNNSDSEKNNYFSDYDKSCLSESSNSIINGIEKINNINRVNHINTTKSNEKIKVSNKKASKICGSSTSSNMKRGKQPRYKTSIKGLPVLPQSPEECSGSYPETMHSDDANNQKSSSSVPKERIFRQPVVKARITQNKNSDSFGSYQNTSPATFSLGNRRTQVETKVMNDAKNQEFQAKEKSEKSFNHDKPLVEVSRPVNREHELEILRERLKVLKNSVSRNDELVYKARILKSSIQKRDEYIESLDQRIKELTEYNEKLLSRVNDLSHLNDQIKTEMNLMSNDVTHVDGKINKTGDKINVIQDKNDFMFKLVDVLDKLKADIHNLTESNKRYTELYSHEHDLRKELKNKSISMKSLLKSYSSLRKECIVLSENREILKDKTYHLESSVKKLKIENEALKRSILDGSTSTDTKKMIEDTNLRYKIKESIKRNVEKEIMSKKTDIQQLKDEIEKLIAL